VPPVGPAGPADPQAAAETANLAADAAQRALREGVGAAIKLQVPRVAGSLAKAATALALSGEHALAAQRWAEAMAAAETEPDSYHALADLAQAQIRADQLDAAAQLIGVMLNESPASASDWQANAVLDPAWQAAAALVAALAKRGDTARAASVLQMIPDFALSYPGAVRALARAVAAADLTAAEIVGTSVAEPCSRSAAATSPNDESLTTVDDA
jgi:hypothetical protein